MIAFRRPADRFKPIDQDGYIALDTATGQLCFTVKRFPGPEIPTTDTKVLILRNVPTCSDLR